MVKVDPVDSQPINYFLSDFIFYEMIIYAIFFQMNELIVFSFLNIYIDCRSCYR